MLRGVLRFKNRRSSNPIHNNVRDGGFTGKSFSSQLIPLLLPYYRPSRRCLIVYGTTDAFSIGRKYPCQTREGCMPRRKQRIIKDFICSHSALDLACPVLDTGESRREKKGMRSSTLHETLIPASGFPFPMLCRNVIPRRQPRNLESTSTDYLKISRFARNDILAKNTVVTQPLPRE
jgi:hypothetical protein